MSVVVAVAEPIPVELDLELIQKVATGLNQSLKTPAGQVNVKLVDGEEITTLNEGHGGEAYATDVLSFGYIEEGRPWPGEIGDVAVNYQLAANQAQAAGISLSLEVATLILHGILHILGYDHQTPQEQTQMNQLQRQIITGAGESYRDFRWE